MDRARAKRIAAELLGKKVGDWTVGHVLGAGKSAIVFRGERNGFAAAVKVFDPEMVERFGREIQLGRVNRELALRDQRHPNLVEILDGGECSASGYFFVVMGLVDALALGSMIADVPRGEIWSIIGKVASAARFLEERQPPLAHRDIKPDNIALPSSFRDPVLLDLGVVRPVALGDLTDEEESKPFVGTLRYSSPELLVRDEEDTVEGWRAVTFYQLGAVLHDLVMKKPLFANYGDPYALLVEAVRNEVPVVDAGDVPPDLLVLARNCLVKDPLLRLSLVRWADFEPHERSSSPLIDAKARMERHRAARQVAALENAGEDQKTRAAERMISDVIASVERLIRAECTGNALFPPLETRQTVDDKVALLRVCFNRSQSLGLRGHVFILLRVELLDVSERALQIECEAGFSVDRTAVEAASSGASTTIFRGSYEEAVVSSLLREAIYGAVDRVQNGPSLDEHKVSWFPEVVPKRGGAS